MKATIISTIFLMLLGFSTTTIFAQTAAPALTKFEPPDGKTIVIIGQARDEIALYRESVSAPGGLMMYSSFTYLEGLTQTHRATGCDDGGTQDLQDWVRNNPDSVMQLGVYAVDQLDKINNGMWDNNIRTMANILRAANKPVFLRFGYEFDGPWNHYDPAAYRAAWQRMVNIFRGVNVGGQQIAPVNNVAFVWHSGGFYTFNNRPFSDWYPGDEFVDWAAISWFAYANASNTDAAVNARQNMKNFAQAHGKPLMIAEAAPKQYFNPRKINAWNDWYAPVFSWIEANNVKAFSYINQNWVGQGLWQANCSDGDWDNTRVQQPGTRMLRQWRVKVSESRYLNASPNFYNQIGFVPNP
ncbi:MAG: glycosyl hydrolase [Acidobacteriota bacterium]